MAIAAVVAMISVAFSVPSGASDHAVERAEELISSAGFTIEEVPELVESVVAIERWVRGIERRADDSAKVVAGITADIESAEQDINVLETEYRLISDAVADVDLTKTAIGMRNQLPVIQAEIDQASYELEVLHVRLDAAKQSEVRSVDSLMVAWALRQDLASKLAAVSESDTPLLSENALAKKLQVAAEELHAEAKEVVAALPQVQFGDQPEFDDRSAELMIWPQVAEVNSEYGMRLHPVWGGYRMHTGVDIDGSRGDELVAVQQGVVVRSGWNGGYGKTVEIDHGDGVSSLYAHLSELHVAVGDTVEQNDVIGTVGSSGTATAAHLHFEIRLDSEPADPLEYLP